MYFENQVYIIYLTFIKILGLLTFRTKNKF